MRGCESNQKPLVRGYAIRAAEGRRRNTLASAKMGVAVEGRRRNLLASARMEVAIEGRRRNHLASAKMVVR